jgi:hypothetical protein
MIESEGGGGDYICYGVTDRKPVVLKVPRLVFLVKAGW